MKSVDEQFMQRALELARKAEGMTRPNPPVGAVLVKDGQLVAEAYHERAGQDHAERACLKKVPAGIDLSDATLYVTLEPCSTHGRTPPCTDIVREKGVGRVVISVVDLNPDHAGRGLKILEDAGVEVVTGVCEAEGRRLIAPFEKFITTGMPYVTLKLASTLDGKIADRNGDSKWITGPEAREVVQQMRRAADAVVVGAGTVRADDPSLLPRPAEGREPWRVVVGKNIPADAKVLTDEAAERTLVCDGPLEEILKELAARNVMHVLCEGGGQLAAALIDQDLVDEYAFFVAPKIIGPDGRPNVGGEGRLMADLKDLRFTSVEQLGNDVLMRAINLEKGE
ncbi:bifunctional diaminohydroxyphosphoribosylaminopyrimidine deaminase/5-amino-6-(5-phosphoribosylamino)uracil reductase RibD [Verrucomicrobiota bacterium]